MLPANCRHCRHVVDAKCQYLTPFTQNGLPTVFTCAHVHVSRARKVQVLSEQSEQGRRMIRRVRGVTEGRVGKVWEGVRGWVGGGAMGGGTGGRLRADYNWSITHEHSGTVVTHDCAPIARMSILRVRTCIPTSGLWLILWFICARVSMSSFVPRVPCIVIGGVRGPSLGVCSLGGARMPSRGGAYYTRGRGFLSQAC